MDDYGLTVEVRQEPGHVLVTVAGEIDIATVPHCGSGSRAGSQRAAADRRPGPGHLHRRGPAGAAGGRRRPGAARGAACMRYAPGTRSSRLFTITGLDRQIRSPAPDWACQNLAAAREMRVNGHRQHAP